MQLLRTFSFQPAAVHIFIVMVTKTSQFSYTDQCLDILACIICIIIFMICRVALSTK